MNDDSVMGRIIDAESPAAAGANTRMARAARKVLTIG
jgi:hypothetical protein